MSKKSILKARVILGLMLFIAAIAIYAGAFSLSPSSNGLADEINFVDITLQNPSSSIGIVGLGDVSFEQLPQVVRHIPGPFRVSYEYVEQLLDFNYISNRIFLADPSTVLLPSDIDVLAFLEKDLTIDLDVDGPQVLIFHTHSLEEFVDSRWDDPMSGIMGVGAYLADVLRERHGIEVLHYTGRFDVVSGIPQRPGSYERMEPVIRQILADNPSIQIVIDLHRDGIPESHPPLVTYINGVRTAQIMFFNGLSRRYRNGIITNLDWLVNPYQRENLAFSFNLQLAANSLYPGIARRIYLREFRYSLHMAPLSTLIEVGAQNNTFQEAINAMYPLSDIIAAVVLKE